MNTVKSKEEVLDLLKNQSFNGPEAIWETLDSEFSGRELEYLDFLVQKGYISDEQRKNWIRVFEDVYNCYDASEDYANIEAMTYSTLELFPIDVVLAYGLDEGSSLTKETLEKENLINVPIFIESESIEDYSRIYLESVLPIIAEYLHENWEIYKDKFNK